MRHKPRALVWSIALTALAILSGCAYPGAGSTEIMRNAAPGSEVACVDTINRKLGKIGGAVVASSTVQGNRALVDLYTIQGTHYRCNAPRTVTIPYGAAAR